MGSETLRVASNLNYFQLKFLLIAFRVLGLEEFRGRLENLDPISVVLEILKIFFPQSDVYSIFFDHFLFSSFFH